MGHEDQGFFFARHSYNHDHSLTVPPKSGVRHWPRYSVLQKKTLMKTYVFESWIFNSPYLLK
jgi:hypothetical protein